MLFPEKVDDHEYDALIDGEIKRFKLSHVKTSYLILIFYPMDFTFVCPTEIICLSDLKEKFLENDTSVAFGSSDSVYAHKSWASAERDQNGVKPVHWPMVSDINRKLAPQFNMFNEETGTCMRATVILDSKLRTRHISAYMDQVGRSSKELLRLIRALTAIDSSEHPICPIDFED